METWHELEEAAPGLAQLGRRRFQPTHVTLLGSIRKDGSPRISPVEPYLVLDHRLLGMLSGSHEALDLLRDSRFTVHSSVSDVNGSEGEFKLGRRCPLPIRCWLHGYYEAWWTAKDARWPDAS
jgi:hypothetical protein